MVDGSCLVATRASADSANLFCRVSEEDTTVQLGRIRKIVLYPPIKYDEVRNSVLTTGLGLGALITVGPMLRGADPNWVAGAIVGVLGAGAAFGRGVDPYPLETIAVNQYTLKLDYYY